ncbi:putative vesicular transport protein [Pseudohyphozyma bogoriensis]|nr:putative vesicular transport protein [Pseudohyphozyma bogoriensis]
MASLKRTHSNASLSSSDSSPLSPPSTPPTPSTSKFASSDSPALVAFHRPSAPQKARTASYTPSLDPAAPPLVPAADASLIVAAATATRTPRAHESKAPHGKHKDAVWERIVSIIQERGQLSELEAALQSVKHLVFLNDLKTTLLKRASAKAEETHTLLVEANEKIEEARPFVKTASTGYAVFSSYQSAWRSIELAYEKLWTVLSSQHFANLGSAQKLADAIQIESPGWEAYNDQLSNSKAALGAGNGRICWGYHKLVEADPTLHAVFKASYFAYQFIKTNKGSPEDRNAQAHLQDKIDEAVTNEVDWRRSNLTAAEMDDHMRHLKSSRVTIDPLTRKRGYGVDADGDTAALVTGLQYANGSKVF